MAGRAPIRSNDPAERRHANRARWRRRGCRRVVEALVSYAVLALGPQVYADGRVHALLINGGDRPASNYLSHLHHLEDMFEVLRQRGVHPDRIHVFSADGQSEDVDLAARDTKPPDFWLLEDTAIGRRLQPRSRLINTEWPGVILRPATRAALEGWFDAAGGDVAPDDRLFVFVTDHGTGNKDEPDNGAISLWEERLSVREFKDLLGRLPAGLRVVMVMSQCYSGTFADAMYRGGLAEPAGDVCGFFSTQRDLLAHGCYPEGRDRDRIGHAFRFIDAMTRRATTAEAHVEVLVTDRTPDVPLRTSDVYAERLVTEAAAAEGTSLDAAADALLREAWRNRAVWEPEIRLLDRIGETFGAFSPRALAEISPHEAEFSSLSAQMRAYANRWRLALADLKQAGLERFLAEHPDWRLRLDDEALEGRGEATREALVADLLPALAAYLRGQPELWERLDKLSGYARRSSEAVWRLDVRRAALRRMRSVLLNVAARTLLGHAESDPARRRVQGEAFARLQQCEALAVGPLPEPVERAEPPPVMPFPPFAEELVLVDEVRPSWLGVGFREVPKSVRDRRRLADGATLVQVVYPKSPAEAAGLRPSDIVLGPPGQPFDSERQLREWAMVSPRDVPLPLEVVRAGADGGADRTLEVILTLHPYPLELPRLPGPPRVGHRAPALPSSLKPLGASALPALADRSHLLFFWATWCEPCKTAIPEVTAFADAGRLPVLAISDEDPETVTEYLDRREGPFFDQIAIDPLRESFLAHGVSGTPTIVVVDAAGIISHRQVGYNEHEGLGVDGWKWSKP